MALGNRGGRPPKPTALKLLEGNPGKRKLNDAEPQFAVGLPEPPKHLDAVARRRYAEVGAMLLERRVMTEADMGILAMYAVSWSHWVMAETDARRERRLQQEIEQRWDDILVEDEAQLALEKRIRHLERRAMGESPAVKRSREERLLLDRFGGQLGLSPTMRTKVRAEAPEKKDEFEDFLGNG